MGLRGIISDILSLFRKKIPAPSIIILGSDGREIDINSKAYVTVTSMEYDENGGLRVEVQED